MALPSTTPAGTGKQASSLARSLDEEYHNPLDSWSTRDLLLSLVPFIVTFAFKDAALPAAIAFGIAWSGALLILRLALFDGWHKLIWPVLDIISVIAFAILRGFIKQWPYHITKWWNVILPLVYIATAAISLVWRRSFTAHHGRFPKFDKGGRGVWHGDASFRRTSDLSTLGWITAWSISLLLSLIPILTGHWYTWHALNVIFNYVIPFVLVVSALVFQQLMGKWYQSTASKATATSLTPGERGAAYPSGAAEGLPGTTGGTLGTEAGGVPGGGATYTSTV